MNDITLVISGEPMGKARPRAFIFKGHVRVYTPQKTVNYETRIQERFATLYPKFKPWAGPVSIRVYAFFKIPKSTSKTTAKEMISGKVRPTKKPDLSNILKVVEDALNGVAYLDDSQVVDGSIHKYYGFAPMVEINIRELGGQND